MARDAGDDFSDDFPLTPEEALDSDEIRNNDGDETVDPPERWIDPTVDESLDERLSEEEPEVKPEDIDPRDADDADRETELMPDDRLDGLDPSRHGSENAQIDGTPEDGESFFDVVE
ncbi:MAG TPA: hypothetical protein VJR50_14480 [Mycobacterium sp.]|nr:hypothetical protein [Mycobacterium sp.]